MTYHIGGDRQAQEHVVERPKRERRPTARPNESIDLDFSVDELGGESEETYRHPHAAANEHTSPGTERLRRPTNEQRAHSSGAARLPRAPKRQRSDAVQDPNIDRVLGSYRLLSLLGEGGMGRVYCAEHTKLGRRVALKLLRPEYAAKRDAVHRFFQEARAVNAIGHQNIVDITDYVELASGETFFIMELLQGRNLGTLIRKRDVPLPLHDAMSVAIQVCDALQAAHEKQIVHRDLKPDNIFVTDDPGKGFSIKLLDFGVAKLMGEAAAELSWETAAGSVLGTPAYMSPEQATGLNVDNRTDIYSLGAILYEMFTGQPVFRAKSFGEFVMKHMNDQPVPPSQVAGASIPSALEQIILRCLEKDPDDRYESVADLREDLARATATVERAIRRSARGASSPGLVALRQRLAVAGVALTVGAAALAAFWFAAGIGADDVGREAVSASLSGEEPTRKQRPRARAAAKRLSSRKAAKGPRRAARLQLLSEPSGASVYRKGEPISLGTTPLTLDLLDPGSYIELMFQLPGHEQASERVRITDNAVISVTLEPRQDRDLIADPDVDPESLNELETDGVTDLATKRGAHTRRRPPAKKRIRPGEMIDPFGTK